MLITIMKLIGALLLGVFVFLITKFNGSEEKTIKEFIYKKHNFIAVILNLATGLIIIFAWLDDPNVLIIAGISEITVLTAAVLGFTGNTLWNSITESTSKSSKTKLGINGD